MKFRQIFRLGSFLLSSVPPILGATDVLQLANSAPRPHVSIPYANEVPSLAALEEDPVWKDAAVLTDFPWSLAFRPPAPPPPPMEVRLLWRPEALFVRFVSEGSGLTAPFTGRDEKHYLGDVVEVFLDPVGDGRLYYEFQISPANQVLDQRIELRGDPGASPSLRLRPEAARNLKFDLAWTAEGLETASKIHPGADGKARWVAEAKIPAAAVLAGRGPGRTFAPGILRANFLRYAPTPVPPDGESSMINWAVVLRGCPHLSPAAMGYLELLPAPER